MKTDTGSRLLLVLARLDSLTREPRARELVEECRLLLLDYLAKKGARPEVPVPEEVPGTVTPGAPSKPEKEI